MAKLPLIDFTWSRDPKGYHLVESKSAPRLRVVRNGAGNDLVPCRPLAGDEFRVFASIGRTPEGVLDFIQRYGPLSEEGHGSMGEQVHYVMFQATTMHQLLAADSDQRPPLLPIRPVVSMPSIFVQAAVYWDPTVKAPRWWFGPNSLLDALWLQFGEAVTRGAQIRACQHCGRWFETGAGTGRRADAKFCSDEHRIAFNSLKRSKGD
jgi:hypothetical protein